MSQLTALYGEHARHVSGWFYVQDAGDGAVAFVGASRTAAPPHPLRYGSELPHQFILGEIIVRPHLVVETDQLVGYGLTGLVTADHRRTIESGAILLDVRPRTSAPTTPR